MKYHSILHIIIWNNHLYCFFIRISSMAAVWPCFAFVMVLLSYFITPSSVQHSGNHYHNVPIPTPFDKSNEFISFADISIHFWGLWVHGHFALCQNVLEHEILYMVNVMGTVELCMDLSNHIIHGSKTPTKVTHMWFHSMMILIFKSLFVNTTIHSLKSVWWTSRCDMRAITQYQTHYQARKNYCKVVISAILF